MPRDMLDFWVTFIEKWLNRAKKIASTIDIMGNFCYALFSLAVKAALQKNPFMNPSTYSPTIPVSLIGRRLFVITLVSAVLSVSLPTRAVATDADVFPVVASVQAPVAEEEVADYHFEVPQYTTVTVLRTYNYVPMTAYTSRPEETDDTPLLRLTVRMCATALSLRTSFHSAQRFGFPSCTATRFLRFMIA